MLTNSTEVIATKSDAYPSSVHAYLKNSAVVVVEDMNNSPDKDMSNLCDIA